jgi:hypothetical protein
MSDTLYNYVEETGLIVPDTSTLLTEVQGEYTGAFGAGMNTDSSTPQGILIAGETEARAEVVQNNATVANQINPNVAGGVFLDAIAALTGLQRTPDTFTLVEDVLLTGAQNSIVPAGAQAATTAGDLFTLNEQVELTVFNGTTWTGTGDFTAVEPGPIPCGAAGAGLTSVETDVLGWETVSNANAGTLGTLQQLDVPFRQLRRNTLALQGVALIEAILSGISNISGVIGRQGLENYTNADATIEGIFLLANSIWVCVDGGTAQDIATVLLQKKSMGANWNGAQSLAVIEPASGQAYTVLWDVPTLVPLLAQVTVKQGTYVGNPALDVNAAVVAFAANQIEGLQGFTVGESASPFEIAAAIQQQCPGIYVKSVQLALFSGTPTYAPAEIAMAINQKATLNQAGVTVILVT